MGGSDPFTLFYMQVMMTSPMRKGKYDHAGCHTKAVYFGFQKNLKLSSLLLFGLQCVNNLDYLPMESTKHKPIYSSNPQMYGSSL